ncbi:MAG: GNAT family N-acetyltransferase [Wenzhouxiangella sp.]|nr:GNAT family N-acetyltransferase [Wenzhouxiangella sp.]
MEKEHTDQALKLRWKDSDFASLSTGELYAILAARVDVFVVEQDCPYPELDGLDQTALHLWAANEEEQVAAYARITAPGTRFEEPSIGRVITTSDFRGQGLGRALMNRALELARKHYPGASLRISAQQHLQPFYETLGFAFVCGPYDEDGIPHVEMLRSEQ